MVVVAPPRCSKPGCIDWVNLDKDGRCNFHPLEAETQEAVDHPAHYGGADNPYEAIKVIDAWGLGFSLGNAVKYISRAGKKGRGKDSEIEDLRKARWYLDHQIQELENAG